MLHIEYKNSMTIILFISILHLWHFGKETWSKAQVKSSRLDSSLDSLI